jgi:F0F1-type ATP synthase membrane subunit c/vacuolar-type H+-ATPase subunit K
MSKEVKQLASGFLMLLTAIVVGIALGILCSEGLLPFIIE